MILLLVLITIFARLIPHVPNFSPLIAIALFSGAYLSKRQFALFILPAFILSEIIIGVKPISLFVWATVAIIYFIGYKLQQRKTFNRISAFTLGSSFLFFIITNFGVWLLGWYPSNLEGLIQCYIYALPFFRTSLLSNLIYVGLLFTAGGLLQQVRAKKQLAKNVTR